MTLALDEGDVLVVADKHRINQAISNLLNNAIKFTKQGHITMFYRVQNRAIFLRLVYYVTVPKDWIGKEVIVKTKQEQEK